MLSRQQTRFLLVAILITMAAIPAAAQTTTVTGTITDAQGNAYALGTASAYKVVASGQPTVPPVTVPTSAAGFFTFSGVSALASPASYQFTVCAAPVLLGAPNTNPTPKQICFTSGPIAVSGASQDISTTLNAIAPTLGPQGQGVSPNFTNINVSAAANLNGGGTLAGTYAGNPTLSGNLAVSGTTKASGPVLMGAGPIFDVTAPPFNADPTGVADSTAAIQSAITTAAGRPVYFPTTGANCYKTTAELTYITNGYNPGIKLFGDGSRGRSAICAAFSNGNIIRLEGVGVTLAQAQVDGYIRDLDLTVSGTQTNLNGIKITASQGLEIYGNRIFGLPGDGIQIPLRSDIAANSDNYGSSFIRIIKNEILFNTGWGINASIGINMSDTIIESNRIIGNQLGGIFHAGGDLRISVNAIAQNGANASGVCGLQCGGGVLAFLSGSGSGQSSGYKVENNEFDGNYAYDIWIRKGLGIKIETNRFHSNSNFFPDNLLHPPTQIALGGGTSVVTDVGVQHNFHRSDTTNNLGLTLVQLLDINSGFGKIGPNRQAAGDNSTAYSQLNTQGGAMATATVSGGAVTAITSILPGWNYSSPPTCTVVGVGSSATCTAVTATVLSGVDVATGGSLYTSAPAIGFTGQTCTTTPTATAFISSGVLQQIYITNYGVCSVGPTAVTVTGGGGSGGTATVTNTVGVTSYTIGAGGSGYVQASTFIRLTPVGGTTFTNNFVDNVDTTALTQSFNIPFAGTIPLTSTAVEKWGTDTGLSRFGAGALAIGNGTQGDVSGTLRAASFTISGIGSFTSAGSTLNSTVAFSSAGVLPNTAGGFDVGSASTPWANLWLGTAATNNFKFQPAATAAARIISIPDPLANVTLGLSYNTTTGYYQSKRGVAGCTTAASIGGTCASDITVTWGTAFGDANYSVTCTGSTPTAVPAAPFVVSGTKLAATVHINYFAITAVAASYATIDCVAVHD